MPRYPIPGAPAMAGGSVSPYRQGDNIADLIYASGAGQANAALAQGNIWGNTIANVGQGIGDYIGQREQAKQASKRDAAWVDYVENGDWHQDPTKAYATALKVWGPKDGPAQFQALQAATHLAGDKRDPEKDAKSLGQIIGAMSKLDEPARARLYPQAHMLAKKVYPDIEYGDQYDPQRWPELDAVGAQLRGEKPPELKTATVPGPNGKPMLKSVTPEELAAGVPTYVAPKEQTPGSIGDYMTADPARQAEILKAKKALGQADDRPRVDVRVGGPGTGSLDPDGIEYAATQYRLTGKMPSLGMGNAEAKAGIINSAAKQAKVLGQTPVASIQKQAAYAGDTKALAKMQTMSAAAESFEQKAIGQADIVSELSKKVDRSQFPLINQAILSGKAQFGDKNTQLLHNAITTFSAEYAKIMEGSTGSAAGSSDAARKAAERLISAKLNNDTLQATLDLMRKEMRLTIGGYDATINHINERMGGAPAGPPGPAVPIPPPAAGPEITATGPNGQKLVLRNGQWVSQ